MNPYGSINLTQIKIANSYDIIGVNLALPSLMRFLPTKRITGPAQVNCAQYSINKDKRVNSFRDRRICFKVARLGMQSHLEFYGMEERIFPKHLVFLS